jgi:mRNA interferase MazF
MKRFLEWIGLKEKLHQATHQPPHVSERDLWWASVGENVGSEMNGKSERFSRPVLILKKLAHGFFLIAPTTTQPREGTWYVHVSLKEQDEYVCLRYEQLTTGVSRRSLAKSTAPISTP